MTKESLHRAIQPPEETASLDGEERWKAQRISRRKNLTGKECREDWQKGERAFLLFMGGGNSRRDRNYFLQGGQVPELVRKQQKSTTRGRAH